MARCRDEAASRSAGVGPASGRRQAAGGKRAAAGHGRLSTGARRSGGSLIFMCEKHVKTEVALIFERYDSYREFKGQFRFISLQFYY